MDTENIKKKELIGVPEIAMQETGPHKLYYNVPTNGDRAHELYIGSEENIDGLD